MNHKTYSFTSSAKNFIHTDEPNRISSISFIGTELVLEHRNEKHRLLYVQFQT